MKNYIVIIILLLNFYTANAQKNYTASINTHRENYKKEFLADDHSPLKTKQDLAYLDFYKPNILYKFKAKFTPITDTIGFEVLTHSNKKKWYYKYGKCEFVIKNQVQVLYIYQIKDLMSKQGLEDYLFIPFNDNTNSVTTFGGGRYLDFKISDIKNNTLIIDFNRAYNPYCMYGTGYNCPIPPSENNLNIYIYAGEKLYKKTVAQH